MPLPGDGQGRPVKAAPAWLLPVMQARSDRSDRPMVYGSRDKSPKPCSCMAKGETFPSLTRSLPQVFSKASRKGLFGLLLCAHSTLVGMA
jgi:hypothetical protein